MILISSKTLVKDFYFKVLHVVVHPRRREWIAPAGVFFLIICLYGLGAYRLFKLLDYLGPLGIGQVWQH